MSDSFEATDCIGVGSSEFVQPPSSNSGGKFSFLEFKKPRNVFSRARVGQLFIRVLDGRDLAAKGINGLSNPFVECIVHQGLMRPTFRYKTEIANNTLNPVWNSALFEADIFQLENSRITFLVKHKEGTKDIFMGEGDLSLEECHLTKQTNRKWIKLSKGKVKQPSIISGEIRVELSFEADENFESENPNTTTSFNTIASDFTPDSTSHFSPTKATGMGADSGGGSCDGSEQFIPLEAEGEEQPFVDSRVEGPLNVLDLLTYVRALSCGSDGARTSKLLDDTFLCEEKDSRDLVDFFAHVPAPAVGKVVADRVRVTLEVKHLLLDDEAFAANPPHIVCQVLTTSSDNDVYSSEEIAPQGTTQGGPGYRVDMLCQIDSDVRLDDVIQISIRTANKSYKRKSGFFSKSSTMLSMKEKLHKLGEVRLHPRALPLNRSLLAKWRVDDDVGGAKIGYLVGTLELTYLPNPSLTFAPPSLASTSTASLLSTFAPSRFGLHHTEYPVLPPFHAHFSALPGPLPPCINFSPESSDLLATETYRCVCTRNWLCVYREAEKSGKGSVPVLVLPHALLHQVVKGALKKSVLLSYRTTPNAAHSALSARLTAESASTSRHSLSSSSLGSSQGQLSPPSTPPSHTPDLCTLTVTGISAISRRKLLSLLRSLAECTPSASCRALALSRATGLLPPELSTTTLGLNLCSTLDLHAQAERAKGSLPPEYLGSLDLDILSLKTSFLATYRIGPLGTALSDLYSLLRLDIRSSLHSPPSSAIPPRIPSRAHLGLTAKGIVVPANAEVYSEVDEVLGTVLDHWAVAPFSVEAGGEGACYHRLIARAVEVVFLHAALALTHYTTVFPPSAIEIGRRAPVGTVADILSSLHLHNLTPALPPSRLPPIHGINPFLQAAGPILADPDRTPSPSPSSTAAFEAMAPGALVAHFLTVGINNRRTQLLERMSRYLASTTPPPQGGVQDVGGAPSTKDVSGPTGVLGGSAFATPLGSVERELVDNCRQLQIDLEFNLPALAPYVDLCPLVVGFALSACDLVVHTYISPNAPSHADFTPEFHESILNILNIFRVVRDTYEMAMPLVTRTPTLTGKLKQFNEYFDAFFPYVELWLTVCAKKLEDFALDACRLDPLEPLSPQIEEEQTPGFHQLSGQGNLHSDSVIHLFTAFSNVLSDLESLRWNERRTLHSLVGRFLLAVGQGVARYSTALQERAIATLRLLSAHTHSATHTPSPADDPASAGLLGPPKPQNANRRFSFLGMLKRPVLFGRSEPKLLESQPDSGAAELTAARMKSVCVVLNNLNKARELTVSLFEDVEQFIENMWVDGDTLSVSDSAPEEEEEEEEEESFPDEDGATMSYSKKGFVRMIRKHRSLGRWHDYSASIDSDDRVLRLMDSEKDDGNRIEVLLDGCGVAANTEVPGRDNCFEITHANMVTVKANGREELEDQTLLFVCESHERMEEWVAVLLGPPAVEVSATDVPDRLRHKTMVLLSNAQAVVIRVLCAYVQRDFSGILALATSPLEKTKSFFKKSSDASTEPLPDSENALVLVSGKAGDLKMKMAPMLDRLAMTLQLQMGALYPAGFQRVLRRIWSTLTTDFETIVLHPEKSSSKTGLTDANLSQLRTALDQLRDFFECGGEGLEDRYTIPVVQRLMHLLFLNSTRNVTTADLIRLHTLCERRADSPVGPDDEAFSIGALAPDMLDSVSTADVLQILRVRASHRDKAAGDFVRFQDHKHSLRPTDGGVGLEGNAVDLSKCGVFLQFELSKEEAFLLKEYPCHWKSNIRVVGKVNLLILGTMYLTPKYVLWKATFQKTAHKIPISDIQNCRKARNAKIFDNSIEIALHTGEVFFFHQLLPEPPPVRSPPHPQPHAERGDPLNLALLPVGILVPLMIYSLCVISCSFRTMIFVC